MHNLAKKLALLLSAWLSLAAAPAAAQPVIGQCLDNTTGIQINFFPDYSFASPNAMGVFGPSRFDPSGQTFLQIAASNPQIESYFVGWQGQMIKISPMGIQQIGICNFNPAYVPRNPWTDIYRQPVMSSDMGIFNGASFVPLPQSFVQPFQQTPFAPPMLATPATAQSCYQQTGGERTRFGECMVRAMVGQRERAAYDCTRSSTDRSALAICMVGVMGGERERQIASQLANCRQQYGADYSRYPLCMASGAVPGEAGRLLACVQQQGGNVSVMGTATCYGAEKLQLNPELQIAVQCAVTTGGEPYSFAACTGGQLTAREIDKCFTGGIGTSSGCFGPNNDIVKALQSAGTLLQNQFGPNNDLVKTWNTAYRDLTQGPGPNNFVVQSFRNVGNEVGRTFGPNNDIRKTIEKVVPRIKIKLW